MDNVTKQKQESMWLFRNNNGNTRNLCICITPS